MARPMIEHARACELLRLDRDTGILYWRRNGKPAGTKPKPYVQINNDGRLYYAHRLVWLIDKGEPPPGLLDHRNEIKHDNRPDNLRVATKSQNAQNVRAPKSGRDPGALVGAYWSKQIKRWTSYITVDRKQTFIGSFATAQEAHYAYLAAKRVLHPFAPEFPL